MINNFRAMLSISLLFLNYSWVSAADSLTIPDLILMAKAQRAGIVSIDAVFTTKTKSVDDNKLQAIDAIPEAKMRMLLEIESRKYFLHSETVMETGDPPIISDAAFDGVNETVYQFRSNFGTIAQKDKPPIDPLPRMPVLAAGLLYAPKQGGIGVDDMSLESLLANATLRSSTEVVDGINCYVVDAFKGEVKYATVWLDGNRNGILIRSVGYGRGGKIYSDRRVTKAAAILFQNRTVFLPITIVAKITVGNFTAQVETVAEETTIKLNPSVEKTSFQVNFPPGAQVSRYGHVTEI